MKFYIGLLLLSLCGVSRTQDDSLAGSFLSGLLDTITSTEEAKDCPGVCVHTLATLICYEVLEDIKCPSSSMRCCIENASDVKNTTVATTSRPTTRPTTTTVRTTTEEEPTTKSKDDGGCPGVCVADRIADYCEAYLRTPGYCKSGSKCCVGKDQFSDNPDFQILIGTSNTGNKPQHKPLKTSSEKVHGGPPKSKTNPPHHKLKTQPTTRSPPHSENGGQGQIFNECEGECVGGLFALFCDDIDNDAYCPNEGQCCVAREEKVQTTTPKVTTPPPLPKCPGFCLLNIMAAFCERPSVLISKTSNCNQGSVCCDNTRVATTKRPRPLTRKPIIQTPTTSTTTPSPPTTASPPDPREECPGSCIVGLLSFTCFRNAEMTELFKCKKSGTTCCAPKSKILEVQEKMHRNYTYPAYNPNQNYPPPPVNNYPVPPPGGYPPPPPYYNSNYPQYPPPPPPGYEPTVPSIQPQPTSHSYDIQPTTTPRPAHVYSKYVCGVKGTSRTAKSLSNDEIHKISKRQKRDTDFQDELNKIYQHKSTERLVLGSNLIPIPIIYHDHDPEIPDEILSYNPHIGNYSQVGNYRQARVVGGEDGENGEWCWQVALINSQNQYLCGGALIGTQWVLTAAHCVTNIVRSGDAIYVRVGDYDLTRKYGSPGAQTLKVATTYIHHNHNSQTLDNDIALLKLHGQADLREGVCLVCLPARGVSHAAGKRCTVTGYGYMGESGPIPLRVREAEIPIVSDTECIRKVNAVTEKIFILPASSFCAGGEMNNDACQGDGGGPLVCQDDGFFELAGLVSWGFGCGRQDVPGVYVKVSSFIGWINQIISVNNP